MLALAALGLVVAAPGAAHAIRSEGQLTWGVHISLAPTWFEPAETPGIPRFMVLYALHDAMVKPMPGQPRRASPSRGQPPKMAVATSSSYAKAQDFTMATR